MPVPGTTLTSYRPLMQGVNGMVVASHPSAAMAGLDALRRGGNAIDAGVAVGLALNVVHVDDCSFLGVAPTIMYLADRREVTTIDGLGVWPRAASVEYFKRNHGGHIPPGIPRSLTPAAADAWITALSRFGTMTFADVSASAIELAGKGFPMYRYLSDRLHTAFDLYNAWPTTAEVFLPNGRPPRRGEMFYQRDLAATLARLAEIESSNRGRGREAALQAVRDHVYLGELGKKIAAYSQEQGGLISEEDMASCRVSVEPPVSVGYRGYRVYCTGPWGQGPTCPQALKILEGFDLASMGHNSVEYVHTVSQALNLAFADREKYVGDPRFVDVPIDAMLSEEYLAQRRSLIDPGRAWPAMPPAGDPRRRRAVLEGSPRSPGEAPQVSATAGDHGGGTSYFAVIDREGNVFSCTPSEGTKSGGPIIPGTGLAFSLRGYQSKVDEAHPSSVEPGKASQAHARAGPGAPGGRARDGRGRSRRRPHPPGDPPAPPERPGVRPRPPGSRGGAPLLQLQLPQLLLSLQVRAGHAQDGGPHPQPGDRGPEEEGPRGRTVSRLVGGFGPLLHDNPGPGHRGPPRGGRPPV